MYLNLFGSNCPQIRSNTAIVFFVYKSQDKLIYKISNLDSPRCNHTKKISVGTTLGTSLKVGF